MWLLNKDAYLKLRQGYSNVKLTDESIARARELVAEDLFKVSASNPGVATIPISGPITNRPDFIISLLFGGATTWPAIRSAIASAENDASITQIELVIDSPGGTVSGMFETMEALANTSKPTTAVVSNMAASAAFSIASQADSIVATNKGATFGSVGVVVDTMVWKEDVSITSTEAPNKRPDLTTEEGKAILRAELDDIHDLMVEGISSGRNTTPDKVNTNFGRGGMLIASKALAAGMIDSIGEKTATNAPTNSTDEGASMDLEKLKAEHPAVYAAIIALGVTQGQATERKRVEAHMRLGKTANALDVSAEAISSGAEVDAEYTSKYLEATMTAMIAGKVSADNADVADVANGAAAPKSKPTAKSDDDKFDDAVAMEVVEALGLDDFEVTQ
jgi:ClpP class serine protease